MAEEPTARRFLDELEARRSDEELEMIQRYFKSGKGEYGEGDVFIGVRMGEVFALAEEFRDMSLDQVEELLESPVHEARAGAVKIMAKQASHRRATDEQRRVLYDLYLRRIDRINNWDLVDLGAWDVVGRYLADKPRNVLDRLAQSDDLWERRTAVLATLHFVRRGEVDDTFRIAELVLRDHEDLVQKAAGGALRAAGDKDRHRLMRFLDSYAGEMSRTMLRYAIEHLDPDQRAHYRSVAVRRE